jgi:hypothetical protein
VGPRVGLDAVEKRKIFHCWESNPNHSARSPLLFRLSYPDPYMLWVTYISEPVDDCSAQEHLAGGMGYAPYV